MIDGCGMDLVSFSLRREMKRSLERINAAITGRKG